MASKPYMPLMMGDWLRGTRGMKAEVRGVYINLLIHQYDHGFIPADMETLALIEPEIGKVWVLLKDKFSEVSPGKLKNKKLEDVRNFWEKQVSNGKKGGRPKKKNPEPNPKINPTLNPEPNHHIDLDPDNELEIKLKSVKKFSNEWFSYAFDELTLEGIRSAFRERDIPNELGIFKLKVRGDPEYKERDVGSIRTAFLYQLKTSTSTNGRRHTNSGTSQTIGSYIDPGKNYDD